MEWLQMNLGIIKSLHIIFMVSWFAGLFYMVRLFIYHVEAEGKEEPEKSILVPAILYALEVGICGIVVDLSFYLSKNIF